MLISHSTVQLLYKSVISLHFIIIFISTIRITNHVVSSVTTPQSSWTVHIATVSAEGDCMVSPPSPSHLPSLFATLMFADNDDPTQDAGTLLAVMKISTFRTRSAPKSSRSASTTDITECL